MKKVKMFFKAPMALVFIFISIVFGFPALGKDAEIDTYAIVTAIGLDKSEENQEEIELSLLTFVPVAEQTFTEKYKVVKASGKSVSEALNFAGLHFGREVGLSHVKTLVINEDLFEDNITLEMDYLARNKSLALSTTLICTDAKASEFLEAVQSLDSESSIKLDDLIQFNNDYIYSEESTIEMFYKGLYNPSRTAIVSFISLDSEDMEGFTVTDGESSGSSEQNQNGSSSQSGTKKQIVNDGDSILCKDGKMVQKIFRQDMKKINLIRGTFKLGSIVIENFSDDLFRNARLTFEMTDNKINRQVQFINGIPVVYIDVKLYVHLTEAQEEDMEIKENTDYKNISDEAIKKLEFEVKNSIKQGIDILRENKCDIHDIYTLLNNSNRREFQRFLNKLDDKDDFLNFVIFKIGVQIYSN